MIQKAKLLSPEFYEVHRVEAIVNNAQEKLTAAKTSYEAAVELEPNSAPLRLWYAQFLFRGFQDFEEAKKQLIEAERLDPNTFEIGLELARLKVILREFSEAGVLIEKLRLFEQLTVWDRKKLTDLKLRFHKDQAEQFCEDRDASNALAQLKLLVKTYIDCPTDLHDFKMREKLRRTLPSALECRTQMRLNGAVDKDITLVIDWLDKYCGAPVKSEKDRSRTTGNIRSRPNQLGRIDTLCDGYGFIKSTKNRRIFFPFSNVQNLSRDLPLQIGQNVSFVLGTDAKNRIYAKRVLVQRK